MVAGRGEDRLDTTGLIEVEGFRSSEIRPIIRNQYFRGTEVGDKFLECV